MIFQNTGNNLLEDDLFCFVTAVRSIKEYGYKVESFNEWKKSVGPLTIFRRAGLELAMELTKNSTGLAWLSEEGVKHQFDSLVISDYTDRKNFLRYFAFCKECVGKGWVKDIKEQIRQKTEKLQPKNNGLLDSDKFCYMSAWTAIIRFGFIVNDEKEWFVAVSPLTTLSEKVGLDLALKLSRNSPGYVSDDDVKRKYNDIIKSNKSNRKYFLRYFKYCKDKMGKDWVSQIQREIKK